jgi:hypothetical protein
VETVEWLETEETYHGGLGDDNPCGGHGVGVISVIWIARLHGFFTSALTDCWRLGRGVLATLFTCNMCSIRIV